MKCRSEYAHLDEKTPLFEVTPGKNCRLFPYIWSKECAEIYNKGEKNPFPYFCRPQGPVDQYQEYNGLNLSYDYNLAGNPVICRNYQNDNGTEGFTDFS